MPLVERLRDAGAAYELEGDVYFSVESDPDFGKVSRLDAAAMRLLSAERGGDPDRPGKKNPLDPMLWMAAREGEPSWDGASLGRGRPGWHIECVAIALDHLGMGFDVQGGGSDLAFPHHEMGASHAQALTGEFPMAKAYVHAGMVALDGEKMSKSKGNLVFVSKLRRDGVDPAAIRLALLAHHYRADWEWTDQVLQDAVDRLGRWRAAVSRPDGPPAEALVEEIREALADRPGRPGRAGRRRPLGRAPGASGAVRTRARPVSCRGRWTRCWALLCNPATRDASWTRGASSSCAGSAPSLRRLLSSVPGLA